MGSSRLVNAYAETGGQDMKADNTLIPCAGMKRFGDDNTSKCRGMIYLEDEDVIYSVNGGQIYEVDSAGTSTSKGIIGGDDNVFMARNDAEPQQLCIVTDGNVFFIEDGALTRKRYVSITVEDEVETETEIVPIGVTFCGGYFVFPLDNGRFYVSELQGNNVSDLDFATAEGNPDGLIAAHGSINTLYLIGPETIEIWAISGGEFPFAKQGGAHLRIGSRSPHTIKDFNNGVAFVGADNVVYLINGYQSQPFSSAEVTKLIEAETDKSNLVAFTYQRGENKFYTLQGSGWTREFNANTGSWHNREDQYENQWHCLHHASAWGKDIFGDRNTGFMFEADVNLFTDDGDELPWGFDTQIIHDAPNGLSFNALELDIETGDGQSKTQDGKVMLSWSDDNGRTYIGERQLSLGKEGEYKTRVRTYGLGQCDGKGRILRLRITDPVVRALAGLYGDVESVAL